MYCTEIINGLSRGETIIKIFKYDWEFIYLAKRVMSSSKETTPVKSYFTFGILPKLIAAPKDYSTSSFEKSLTIFEKTQWYYI